MLRLHPSELTLTPEDADETFRRIAVRQSSRARQDWTMPPAKPPGQCGRPNRPILRRGPQRLVGHAIAINKIPILQPQQAVITSVDEDDDESDREAAQASVRANSRPTMPHSTREGNSATVRFPAVLPSPPIQLPLRLNSHVQAPDGQTIPNEQVQGNTSLVPQNHLPRRARSASTRSIENGNEQHVQLPSVDSSANTLGLRGGGGLASVTHVTQDSIHVLSPLNHIQRLGSRSGRGLGSLACASDIARDTIDAPSPLDQTQRLTSPTQQVSLGDSGKLHSSPGTGDGTPHSKKYSTAETHHSTRCRYPEYQPSSEPRRGSGRQPPTTRSRSSGDAASFNPHGQDVDESNAKWLSSTLEGLGQCDQSSMRRRERGSGATNASTAYSWYGSLGSDSRFPSSETSPNDEPCPQLDSTRTNAHRFSPLPSLPYTRLQPNDPKPLSLPCAMDRRPNRERDMVRDNTTRFGPGPDDSAVRQQSSPEYHTYGSRNVSRTSEYPRLEQHSSENAPGSATVHEVDGARHGRVQMQRAVYERLQSQDAVVDSSASRLLPRQYFGQHSTEFARRASPRVYEGGASGGGGRGGRQGGVPPRREGPLRGPGSSDQSSDTRSSRQGQSPLLRGAPTVPTRTYRRMRGEQRDQENGGDEEMMRREEANVVARYGEEEQQRTTMNETPPKIGRVERRMME